jgi:cardiolipin synthase
MLDWVGSIKMDDDLLQRMKDAGVQVQRTARCTGTTSARMNNRTHRKLLVVDGHIGLHRRRGHRRPVGPATRKTPTTGATCTSSIEGPVVAQFQAAFNDNWIKTTGDGAERRRLLSRPGKPPARWTRTCSWPRPLAAARACT